MRGLWGVGGEFDRRQVFAWSMYDFANTIFSALFVTIFFPLFIVLLGGTAFHVGLVFSLSMGLAALIVPTLGAIADITRRKKFLLFVFTFICCVLTFVLGFLGLAFALIAGLLANFFYHASLDVYDAMLVDISDEKNIGRISGIGTGVGYLGTVLAILAAFVVGRFYDYESLVGLRVIFIVTAVLFFVFSLIMFVYYKEPAGKPPLDSKHRTGQEIRMRHFSQAFGRVVSTIRDVKRFRYLWLFLLASFLCFDAANTAIVFLYLYGRDQLGLSIAQFLPVYLVMALAAMVGSFGFGRISDRVGHKRTLMMLLVGWIIVISLLFFETTYVTFLLTGIFGGAFLGGQWSVTRPLLVELAPREKISELFGYQGLTEKFGGVVGPLSFGAVAASFGFRYALLVVIGLFLASAVVLNFVKIKR